MPAQINNECERQDVNKSRVLIHSKPGRTRCISDIFINIF